MPGQKMRGRNSTTVTAAHKAPPDRASSRPMMPRADHQQGLGDLRLRRGRRWKSTIRFWSTTTPFSGAGSDPVAITMAPASSSLTAPSSGGNRHLARAGDAAGALDPVHLVLLEQELDALGQLADDTSFCFSCWAG